MAEAGTQPPPQAAQTLSAALGLWRGDSPFADLDGTPYAAAEITRLIGLRDSATEHLVAALLDAGDPDSAASQAHARLLDTPYHERLWELLMLARYRQGRQVEALEAYGRAAHALADGLGIDPGPQLRELQAQVLAQDPRLLAAKGRSRHPCPYKGLARYDQSDADLFVGRERLVDELVARLVDSPILVVVGPSGAGKSSLVRAGLTGALARGSLPGSDGWTVVVMTPGGRPTDALERSLEREPALVIIDQAEEALLADDGAFLQSFGDRVLAAVAVGTRIVLAVRADFYGRLGEHPALARLVGPATVLVAPPSDEELHRIVTEPAARVGLAVDLELVERVVSQVRGRPGALPILSTALVRTWEHREGNRLSIAAYAAGGGVEGALQRVGEEAWATLATEEQRTACRHILVRLADDEEGSWVRRRASREEVAPLADTAANAALRALIDRRLVVARAGDLDIAHEALFTEWPRLRGWLEDGRVHAELRARLTQAASAWVASNQDPAELYKGTRLQASLDTVGASPDELTWSEREFLAASVRQSEQELEEQRLRADREAAGRRRSRAVASGLAVALLAAAAAGGFALHQRVKATAAALTSDAGHLGALARTGGDYDRALLYAAQAVQLNPSARTESNLFATLERGEALTAVARGQGAAESIAFSGDGDSVYAVTTDGVLTRSAAADGEPASSVDLDAESTRRLLAVLPDGDVLVGMATGVAVVDPASGRVVQEAQGADPASWALSPDSRTVALVQRGNGNGTGLDSLLMWHLGSPASSATRVRLDSAVVSVTPCGPTVCVFTEDRSLVRVAFDSATASPAVQLPASASAQTVVATADGGRIAMSTADGVVEILDASSGRVVQRLAAGYRDPLALAFSADGTRLATRDFDTILVWRLGSSDLPDRLVGHNERVTAVAFSPDGATMVSSGVDRTRITWDLEARHRLAALITSDLAEGSASLVATDRAAIVGEFGGRIELVDLDSGRVSAFADQGRDLSAVPVTSVGMARAGRLLVTTDYEGLTAVWDVPSRRPVGVAPIPAPDDTHWTGAAVSPDGKLAAVIRTTAGPLVFDPATRSVIRQLPPLPHPLDRAVVVGNVMQGWSSDSHELLLTRSADGYSELLSIDATTGASRFQVRLPSASSLGASSVGVDPAGRFLAVGMWDGTVRFLDARDGHELAPPTTAVGQVNNVAVSPDGRYVAAAGNPGQVLIFDTRTFTEVGTPLEVDVNGREPRVAFTPDGRLVIASGSSLRVIVVDPKAWLERACREAGRVLTQQEWQDVLPGRAYAPACSG